MASIIPGYNYDIFISYRQNDNKYDGWVTEFVDNLNKELEANIKDKISVYFDINPHDGLLETHSVDQSLEDKLKCLIFIPIISRTYCDPKSFAWQHEFVAFNNLAKEDQFGRDIRLGSGNVASRILPVKIHDLDPEDNTILENELGGVLRCIEFIYKSAGVNRPLQVNEDHPQDNLNKTYYRDQINKIANAVKEIITAIKKYDPKEEEVTVVQIKEKHVLRKERNRKIIITSVFVLALVVAGVLFVPRLFKSSEITDKSIAVLPFDNLSDDPKQEYFSDGIVDAILDRLFKIGDLEVVSNTSSKRYKNTTLSLKEIARELDVSSILEGSVQKIGDNVRIIVQLIDTKTDAHLWSETYDRDISDVFSIQSEIAQTIAKELHAIITPEVKQTIEKAPTTNLEAWDAYLRGIFIYEQNKTSITPEALSWFKESIKLDSTFALPWTYLSMCYWRMSANAGSPEFQEAKHAAEKALELDPASGTAIVNIGEILDNEYDFEGAEEKINLALKVDSDNPYVLRNAGRFYTLLGRGEESVSFCTRALQDDPINPTALAYLTDAYFYSGRYKEAWEVLTKFIDLDYGSRTYIYYMLLLEEGNTEKIVNEPSLQDDENAHNFALAAVYFKSGNKSMAEELCADLMRKKVKSYNYWIAFANAYGDDPDEVCNWLERSFAAKEQRLTYLGVNPAFNKFRNEPRIKKLLEQMKFPI